MKNIKHFPLSTCAHRFLITGLQIKMILEAEKRLKS